MISIEIVTTSPLGDLTGKGPISFAVGDSKVFEGAFGKQVVAVGTEEGVKVTELVPARIHNFVFGSKRQNIRSEAIVNNDSPPHPVRLGLFQKVIFRAKS